LWADEIFSLAMATGHSLEHRAADADPTRGDFVEPRSAVPARVFRKYVEHDAGTGPSRVLRAVLLSDTSPPLYYLLLGPWTRWLGTGDAALRLFSVWWWVLSLPLLWLTGRQLGGQELSWSACLLFSFSPVALFTSTEGRMYSLLWFLGLALAWLTFRLAEAGRSRDAALWVLTGAAGLLTHYFFAFGWLACVAWLWLQERPRQGPRTLILAAATLVAVLPWYLQLPDSLARWRVSGNWLAGELEWPQAAARPLLLAGSLLSGHTYLGGWRRADRLVLGLGVVLVIWIVGRGLGGRLFNRRTLLLWSWLGAACTGPLIFDILRHTTTSEVPRYVLPALPAAMLLAATAVSQLPSIAHYAGLAAILVAWLPGDRAALIARPPRPWQPYSVIANRLESWLKPGDVVLVRSIPSGVVGVARYLGDDVPLVSWVAQLGTREKPADLERILRGRYRVAVVSIHDLGAPNAVEPWLEANGRWIARDTFPSSRAEIVYYSPRRAGSEW
jgi:uncharacterized membrane protein